METQPESSRSQGAAPSEGSARKRKLGQASAVDWALLRLGRSASVGAFPENELEGEEQRFLPFSEEIQTRVSHEIERVVESTKNAARRISLAWHVCHFNNLPKWMQDNDFLHSGHRPELYSYKSCFWSIFRMHSETGNIWSHLLGCLLFIGLACYVYFISPYRLQFYDKLAFGAFFAGAVSCLAFSAIFHTVCSHSHQVSKKFNKLDYCGISLLISGSTVPWLYYAFYCSYTPKLCYLICVSVFGVVTMMVSLWEKFLEPDFRAHRVLVFAAFGLSAVIPVCHWVFTHQWLAVDNLRTSIFCLILMAILYLLGGLLYAARIPERYFPGKCDYWFQSHQLFHLLVIAAAIVHYKGVTAIAMHRFNSNDVCESDHIVFQPLASNFTMS